MQLPEGLRSTASTSHRGRRWLEELPALCTRLADRWSVRLGDPFAESHISLVAPADGSGTPAVLKIPLPAEIQVGTLAGDVRDQEAAALAVWSGQGAPELLAHDRDSGAMLIERCIPGTTLDAVAHPEDADEAAAAVLGLLHDQSPDDCTAFDRLADRAVGLAAKLPRRFDRLQHPFDGRLISEAVDILEDLAQPTSTDVLLHGDTHHHNLLSATRSPWLAIDPLPMVGDPAYDAVQYLLFRKGDLTDPEAEWAAVIRRFCHLMGVDPVRVQAWTFVRLVSDALAACEQGNAPNDLEARQGDLWTARLVRRI